jgi:hypothetical protein
MIKRTIGIGTIVLLILVFVIGVGIGIARGNTHVSKLQMHDTHAVSLYQVERAGVAAHLDGNVRLNPVERLAGVARLEPVYLDDPLVDRDLVGAELRLTNVRHERLGLRELRSRGLRAVDSELRPALTVERKGKLPSPNLRGVPSDGPLDAGLPGEQLLGVGFRELDSLHLEG